MTISRGAMFFCYGLGAAALAVAVVACGETASEPGATSTAASELATTTDDGGVDDTVNACLDAYVACLRAPSADANACKATLLGCAAPPRHMNDGGTGKCQGKHGPHGGPPDADGDRGHDRDHGTCLDDLATCAAGSTAADACVSAAEACFASARAGQHPPRRGPPPPR